MHIALQASMQMYLLYYILGYCLVDCYDIKINLNTDILLNTKS